MADQQAGWYPDPSGDTSKLRYWDGAHWTNDFTDVPQDAAPAAQPVQGAPAQTAPAQGAPAQTAPQAQPVEAIPVQPQPQVGVQETTYSNPGGGQPWADQPYVQPPVQQSNGAAIASLICGIIGLCVVLAAIAAIITGVIGRKNPVNRGLATAGLTLGIIGVAGWAVFAILKFIGYSLYL